MSECEIDKFRNKRWFLNGKIHREDGPAIEQDDGRQWFYLYGKEYTHDEFILLQFSRGIMVHD